MAVKIERGGWVLIFLIGAAIVGYSLNRYGLIDLSKFVPGSKSASANGEEVDASKPLLIPASSTSNDAEVRVRVNVWVGCAGGLVANGGLDTQPDSIFGKKGLKVSFKIIDDWTEGAAALATNNVDVMLTTADVYAKDYAQFKERGFGSHAFLMVDWSRGADGVIGKRGLTALKISPARPWPLLLTRPRISCCITDSKRPDWARSNATRFSIKPFIPRMASSRRLYLRRKR